MCIRDRNYTDENLQQLFDALQKNKFRYRERFLLPYRDGYKTVRVSDINHIETCLLYTSTVDCYDSGECNSINVITRDNYELLRESYFRYSLLLQKEGVHMPGNSIGEGIANLYDGKKYHNRYPLIEEWGWNRDDCIREIKADVYKRQIPL